MRTGQNMQKITSHRRSASAAGFSLVEMMVAITVTLVIMGSVYGLIAQGQNAFGREPLVADRQQQIRLAMDRIQKDVLTAGLGLGPYAQTFAPDLNGIGPLGVRVIGDPLLGGGNSDHLEIRSKASECAPVRTAASANPVQPALSGEKLQTLDVISPCFDPHGWEQGWVHLMYPNGWSKFGWLSNMAVANESTFADPQPDGSQIPGDSAAPPHVQCSMWFGNQNNSASPNGAACSVLPAAAVPPLLPDETVGGCRQCDPFVIQAAEMIRYQIGTDTDGSIGLFRSTTGGIDASTGAPLKTDPPGVAWQLVARGIEDMQVEYRSINSGVGVWLDTPALVTDSRLTGPGDIVLEVRVTLWSRVVGERAQVAGNPGDNISGENRAAGNQVMALRGSMTSTIAPRAAQDALIGTGQWK